MRRIVASTLMLLIAWFPVVLAAEETGFDKFMKSIQTNDPVTLLQKKQARLSDLLSIRMAMFQTGSIAFQDVAHVQIELLEAKLALANTDAEKKEVLKKILDESKKLLAHVHNLNDIGLISPDAVAEQEVAVINILLRFNEINSKAE